MQATEGFGRAPSEARAPAPETLREWMREKATRSKTLEAKEPSPCFPEDPKA